MGDVERDVDRELRKRLREPRIRDDDLFETVEEVFDRATVLALLELKQRGCLSKLSGVVSAGKEARVYLAKGKSGEYVAVKIYLTATAEFKKGIWKYIKGDPRYEWVLSLPTHKLMTIWARKEFSNLKRMYEASVSVPKPICVYRNILVMEFIGENGVRAPLLKEAAEAGLLDSDFAAQIFTEIVRNVYRMYWYAGLVHGDLSEYNVMLHGDRVYIIDVSQAVKLEHPNSHMFLYRDISNIVKFFRDELKLRTPPIDKIYYSILNKDEAQLQSPIEEHEE
uniref:non-specific serine/threonine protein kinase n=1 Tax=Ignisphaera aggregans TaxID=334771 RepID=A0A7C4BCA8_9CREN